MSNASTALLVIGMHRSGTSALTRVLNLCGVDLGSNLMPPAEANNEHGFWEHMEAVDINQRLLNHLRRNWWDARRMPPDWLESPIAVASQARIAELAGQGFGASPLWAIKDPRICRLLPLWINGLRDAGVTVKLVFMLRHPAEVVASLGRRDGLSEAETGLLLLNHFFEAMQASAGLPRSVLTYDALLGDWRGCIARVADELAIELPQLAAAAADIDTFLTPAARHHHAGDDDESIGDALNGRIYRLGRDSADSAAFWDAAAIEAAHWQRCQHDLLPYVDELLGLLSAQDELARRPAYGGEHAAETRTASPLTRLQFRMITGLREGVGQLHQIAADLGAMVRMGNEATVLAAQDLGTVLHGVSGSLQQDLAAAAHGTDAAAQALGARFEALEQRTESAAADTQQRFAALQDRLREDGQQALAAQEQVAVRIEQLGAALDALRVQAEQREQARWSQRLRRLLRRE